MVRKTMRKSKRHMHGGENADSRPHAPTMASEPQPVPESIEQTMTGGRKHKKTYRKHKGGSALTTALLPFGLFGLHKLFQRSRKTQREVKRMGRSVKRTATKTVKRVL